MTYIRSALLALALSTAAVAPVPARAQVFLAASIRVAPPPLPVYVQPPVPAPGYIWAPGYWSWDDLAGDYYWIPGAWVLAPQPGYLWTPAWWGWRDGLYVFHGGYWGPHVGFYGGINYGFGYGGAGFQGGYWRGGLFFYNRAVTRVTNVNVINVYNETVVNRTTVNNVSYNGGAGGVVAQPTAQERAFNGEPHLAPTPMQAQHAQAAHATPSLFAAANHGAPPIGATPRAGQLQGPGVVAAHRPGAPAFGGEPGSAPGQARTFAAPGASTPYEERRDELARPAGTPGIEPGAARSYGQSGPASAYAPYEERRNAIARPTSSPGAAPGVLQAYGQPGGVYAPYGERRDAMARPPFAASAGPSATRAYPQPPGDAAQAPRRALHPAPSRILRHNRIRRDRRRPGRTPLPRTGAESTRSTDMAGVDFADHRVTSAASSPARVTRALRCALTLGVGLACALSALAGAPAVAAAADPRALAVLDRVSWGRTDASGAEIARLGVDRWLDGQLRPPARDRLPAAAQAQIDALPVAHGPLAQLVVAADAQSKAANALIDPEQKKAAQQAYQQGLNDLAKQAATRSLLRDLYSPDQLREQMTWFWFNHFNVHQYKRDIRAMVSDYEDQAIRPHALGRFRDLLEATLRHPAMLRYLDNDQNAANHINENYAREIMELHTLGIGSGYSQKDVQELARILTGVGIDLNPTDPKLPPARQALLVRAGLFEFNPNRHDFGDKVFLGHAIKGSGFGEVEQALDLLARDPATARHVSSQLAMDFVSDTPPPELVDAMAQTWKRSDGDISAVLRTMFRSRAFSDSLGRKFKDPVHYAVSSVRLAYGDRVVLNTGPMQGWLNRMSEGLFNHETPDGYSLSEQAWDGPGQLAVRFEIARQIGAGSAGLFKPEGPNTTDAPAFPQLQNALYFQSGQAALGMPTRTALSQARSPQEWNALYLSSPEFMHR